MTKKYKKWLIAYKKDVLARIEQGDFDLYAEANWALEQGKAASVLHDVNRGRYYYEMWDWLLSIINDKHKNRLN